MKHIKLGTQVFATVASALLVASCSKTHSTPSEPQANKSNKLTAEYQANWASVKQHQTPQWFLDAKFGIYFHWGPYSVPAHKTEWYSIWMYREGHPIREYHEKTYGSLDKFGYKDFIPMFTGEHFDAQEWAALFKQAGAEFAGPVTEHADGFAMWDSDLTRWNAKDMGPKKDIVGEMSKAIKAQDMKFIATFHHQWKYAWYPTWDENTDAGQAEFADLYGPKVPEGTFVMADKPTNPLPDKQFNQDWLARVVEVVDKYQPDLVYFDNKMDIIDEKTRLKFLSYYYNHADKNDQEVVVTYKFHDLEPGSAVLDLERARMSDTKSFPWLTDDSIDWDSWSHTSEPNYKSSNRLIDFLVDVVSKNGRVLLNITPTAQGKILPPVRKRLTEMGQWLNQNGEAIYGTSPWTIYGEGPAEVVEGHLSERQNKDNTEKDIRFTTKGDALYAIVLDWPTEPVKIRSLRTLDKAIKSVSLLGSDEKIQWRQTDEGLIIEPPTQQIGKHAFAFKLK
ncbi:alpha-L-fucosidase [Catenovulum adriaticum]|uniref:alpha-L-fucosidase n=1 Tax=Catenovulum adriaticum TaxID=2984846 RepID=A0ABY7AVS2_9ALTE|nr:alpha-L-fucosidase [Catenovulum sp. TS8]WAJ72326.1 alpha-L-fucosidase [Catenovulum sp. TS8]